MKMNKLYENKEVNKTLSTILEDVETVKGVTMTPVDTVDEEGRPVTDYLPADETSALKVKNKIIAKLDEALEDAKIQIEDGELGYNDNVLITGLPGSSKTASVKNWCKLKGFQCFYLDAKNPDLQYLLSGASSIDKTDPEHPKVRTAYSAVLDKINEFDGYTILFLDELNRQTRLHLRASLLGLLADKTVAGEGPGGEQHFDKLLFTVATTNPPCGPDDKSVVPLTDAEIRRFAHVIQFDSDISSTLSFTEVHYDDMIKKKYTAYEASAKTPEDTAKFDAAIHRFICNEWIAKNLLSTTRGFKYTTTDDFQAKAADSAIYGLRAKLLCQSTISEIISKSWGDLDRLKTVIQDYGFSKSDTAMLLKIIALLKDIEPEYTLLLKKKEAALGLDLGYSRLTGKKRLVSKKSEKNPEEKSVDTKKPEPTSTEKEPEPEPEKEDDDDFPETPTSKKAAAAMSVGHKELIDKVKSFASKQFADFLELY